MRLTSAARIAARRRVVQDRLVLKWKPTGWAEESGQIASGIGPFLKEARARRARVYRQPFAARLDKAVRALSIRGRMALDGLYVPADSP
jgi:hypothetical protein